MTRCLRKKPRQAQVIHPTSKFIPDYPLSMHNRAASECVAIGSIFRSDSKKVNTEYCRCSQVPNLLSLLSQTESASCVLSDPAVGLQTTHPDIFLILYIQWWTVDSVKIVNIITIKAEICVNIARLRSSLKSSFVSSSILILRHGHDPFPYFLNPSSKVS